MSGWSLARREALKLDILASLARSQRALARMLESAADMMTVEGPSGGRELLQHLDTLARAQTAIAVKLHIVRPRTIYRGGRPAAPWLDGRVCRTGQCGDGTVQRSSRPA